MTGEKYRYKSLERLGGFEDQTLATPVHDEMVLELLDEVSLTQKVRAVRIIKDDSMGVMLSYNIFTTTMGERNTANMLANGVTMSDEMAHDVTVKYGQDISVEDVHAVWNRLLASYENAVDALHAPPTIRTEVPIMASNKFIIGYWDLVVEFPATVSLDGVTVYRRHAMCGPDARAGVCIEVKPVIASFGAVMRQLNTYRSYCSPGMTVVLYTRDHRFDSAFAGQGIEVV